MKISLASKGILGITVTSCLLLLNSFITSWDRHFTPITFDDSNRPLIAVEIEGNSYPLMVDLGSFAQMSLDRSILEKMNKKSYGTVGFENFRGNLFESPNYLIPEIKIGNTSFYEVIAHEENEACNKAALIWDNDDQPSKKSGIIGRALLKRENIFLDFPHSRIAIVNNANALQKIDYLFETMLKIPFEMTSCGIILTIGTDLGEKRFLLDTGITITAIRSSLCGGERWKKDFRDLNYFNSSQFIIEGTNFGNMNLCLLDITSDMDKIDGFLGMDFLSERIIYIDFRKKILYIDKPD